MQKWTIYSLLVILTVSTINSSYAQPLELLRTTYFKDYSSASALAFFNDKLFVIGDDASQIMILSNDHDVLGHLSFYWFKKKRLAKNKKPDFESALLYTADNITYLIGFGSFSTRKRFKFFTLPLNDKAGKPKIRNIRNTLKGLPPEQINIEGAAIVNEKMVLSNRANNAHPKNHLIIMDFDLKEGPLLRTSKIVPVTLAATQEVTGISDVAYLPKQDVLIFTTSTEQTTNTYDDGEIGDSYLGYIRNFSQQMEKPEIIADKMIPISGLLDAQKLYKIESVTVEREDGQSMILHLAADNDNGASTLFKIRWNFNPSLPG